jgi:hypothetical protein
MVATAAYADGSIRDVTKLVRWSVSGGNAHASNSPGNEGLVTAWMTGNAFVKAELGAVTESAALTVMTSDPALVRVTPASVRIASGTRQSLKATVIFSDMASTVDYTAQMTWTSSDVSVATVADGIVTGVAPGTATITALFPSGPAPASATVIVSAATLTGLSLDPAMSSLPIERTRRFKAIGQFSDGTTQDLTEYAVWGSVDPSRATVNDALGSKGKVLGVGAGAATISASFAGRAASATLNVSAATLEQMSFFLPNSGGLLIYMPFTTVLLASFSDGSTLDVSDQATLVSSDPLLLQVQGMTIVGTNEGDGWVDAQLGNDSTRMFLSVRAGELTNLSISEDPIPPLARGESIHLHATGSYADGSSYELSWFIPWFTDDPAVAWLDEARSASPPKLIAAGAGTTTVHATWASGGTSSAIAVTSLAR